VNSIINRIDNQQFWKFHGGIHPPEQKFITDNKPIRSLSLPKELIIPVQQHIGQAGELSVSVGDTVLKGQPLTTSSHSMAVPIHAPTSGTITAIKDSTIAHPSGLQELCVFLKPDGNEKWVERNICNDYSKLSRSEILQKIANAGISGMGGAGFPTYVKANTSNKIEFLIINAAECEPYITADDLIIREH
jgi:Na+-translocating ferredoxin:NAD+ oxidoreductase subunit C